MSDIIKKIADMKPNEHYIGNDEIIKKDWHKNRVCVVDIDKIDKVIADNLDKEIRLGCTNDWFWTASKITVETWKAIKDGKESQVLSSGWDTFSYEIDGIKYDCSKYVSESDYNIGFICGLQKALNRQTMIDLKKDLEEYKNAK